MLKVKKGSKDNPEHEAKRKAKKKKIKLFDLRTKFKNFKG